MKKWFIAMAIVLCFNGFAWCGMSGVTATTVEYGFACISKQNLSDIMDFSMAKDMQSVQAYLDSQKCILMKGDLKVTVTDYQLFDSTVEFVFQGLKLYTHKKMLILDK